MPQTVKKIYQCPTCKKSHNITLDADLAKNRTKFPFTYVFIHKYEGTEGSIDDIQSDVLTTMYIDAQLNIRGVETSKPDGVTDIVSKETTTTVTTKLMTHIQELQEEFELLSKKYRELEEKYKNLGGK